MVVRDFGNIQIHQSTKKEEEEEKEKDPIALRGRRR